jgi:hypothetical protein
MKSHINSLSRRGRRVTVALVAVAASALMLVGCSTSAPAGDTAKNAAPGSVKLGIAYWETRTYAFQLMLKGAQAVASVDPAIDLTSAAPDAGDPSKLLPLFQAMAQTQKAGIVLQTLAADPFFRPVQQTTSSGTPVIAIDAPPPADAGVDLFITNDNVALGKMLVDEIIKGIPVDAKGEIVIGTSGPAVPPLIARVEGMKAALAAQRPGVTVVGPSPPSVPRGRAKRTTARGTESGANIRRPSRIFRRRRKMLFRSDCCSNATRSSCWPAAWTSNRARWKRFRTAMSPRWFRPSIGSRATSRRSFSRRTPRKGQRFLRGSGTPEDLWSTPRISPRLSSVRRATARY